VRILGISGACGVALQIEYLMTLNLATDAPQIVDANLRVAECFSKREFIRMNESTNTKVHFFRHIIDLALRGKLKTAGQSIASRIDKLLESRTSGLSR
jgi:hypothetical protein